MKGVPASYAGLILGIVAAATTQATGCATLSNRTKTLLFMGGAALAAGAVGAALAPSDENAGAHAVLWGGAAGAVAGAIGLFAFDEEGRARAADERALRAERELRACGEESEPVPIAGSAVGLEKPLPGRFRSLITPGQWSLYRLDRWVSSGESELVHEDLLFRFSQPQLNPNAKALNEGAVSNVVGGSPGTEAPPKGTGGTR